MTSAEGRATQRAGGRDTRWPALAVCLVAGAMTLLDVSIVNVALPSITTGIGADETDVQWIVAGYSLAFGCVLVPAGRLGDARSRRSVFVAGVMLFTAASVACGLAPTPEVLVAARVVQGVGGGMLTPQVSGFIQNLFQGEERARAFGLFGATIGLATALGPLVGGLLVSLGGDDWGWRLVFWINAPIGVAAVVLGLRLLPRVEGGPRESVDPVGVLLFGSGVLLVLLPLVEGRGRDTGWTVTVLAAAAVCLVLFAAWERAWRRRGHASLVEPSLLRHVPYLLGLLLGTFYFAGFTSIFLVLVLYLDGLGYSALQCGAALLPFALGGAVTALRGGRWVTRYGRRLVVLGIAAVAVGLVGIDLLVPRLDSAVALGLAAPLLVAGLGNGLVITPNITLTLAEVDVRQAGVAGGMLQTVQRVGSAIGVALVLGQFYAAVGDGAAPDEALSHALRWTLGLVLAAGLVGVVDLVRRRSATPDAEPATRV